MDCRLFFSLMLLLLPLAHAVNMTNMSDDVPVDMPEYITLPNGTGVPNPELQPVDAPIAQPEQSEQSEQSQESQSLEESGISLPLMGVGALAVMVVFMTYKRL